MTLFVLKVLAGCCNLYFHYQNIVNNDIYFYYLQSMQELNEATVHPGVFLRNWLFNWGDFAGGYNLFGTGAMPYWSDIGVLLHTKFMTLANILSFGHLYTNIIFYNLIYFTGMYCLYRVFYQIQPHKKLLLLAGIFFIPSVLFWCSGIHKDGWVIASIGVILFSTQQLLNRYRLRYLLTLLFSFLILFVIRYFVFLVFVPFYVFWLFSVRFHPKPLFILGLMLTGFFLLWGLSIWVPSFDLWGMVVAKQQEYFKLKGYSDMQTPVLTNHWRSFLQNLPVSLDHVFLQPHIHPGMALKYVIASLDALLICLISLFALVFFQRPAQEQAMFVYSFLAFSLFMYLFIGFTIPNCGALVRYKSVFTACWIPLQLLCCDIPFLRRWYRYP